MKHILFFFITLLVGCNNVEPEDSSFVSNEQKPKSSANDTLPLGYSFMEGLPNDYTSYSTLSGLVESNRKYSILNKLIQELNADSNISIKSEFGKNSDIIYVSYSTNEAILSENAVINYLYIKENNSEKWNPDCHLNEITFKDSTSAKIAHTNISKMINDGSLINEKKSNFIVRVNNKLITGSTRAFAFHGITKGYLRKIKTLTNNN